MCELTNFYVITAGHTGLMAVIDESGQLRTWTTYMRLASVFLTADACTAAIRSLCLRELEEAVRKGRASKEVDEETGETHYLRGSQPLRAPRIKLEVGGSRNIYAVPGTSLSSVRRFARGEFKAAGRNPTRASSALFKPSGTEDEYTSPVSARARRAGAYAHFRG